MTKKAHKLYLKQEEADKREKQIAMVRWKAYQQVGETISNDTVMECLDTWGFEQEKTRHERREGI